MKLRPLVIICGAYSEYQDFLAETGIPKEVTHFVFKPDHLQGYLKHPDITVVYFGTYWNNPIFNHAYPTAFVLTLGLTRFEDRVDNKTIAALQELFPHAGFRIIEEPNTVSTGLAQSLEGAHTGPRAANEAAHGQSRGVSDAQEPLPGEPLQDVRPAEPGTQGTEEPATPARG